MSNIIGISNRTLSYASMTPHDENIVDAAIINRATKMLMDSLGGPNSLENAERIKRAAKSMRLRFGYL